MGHLTALAAIPEAAAERVIAARGALAGVTSPQPLS
jgi:hypothetical protein